MFGLGFGELLVLLVVVVIYLVPAWKIVSKAGYSGALSILSLLPLVNLVALFVFAFSDWPVLRELRERSQGDIPPEAFMRGP